MASSALMLLASAFMTLVAAASLMPPPGLIEAMAVRYNRGSVVFYLPEEETASVRRYKSSTRAVSMLFQTGFGLEFRKDEEFHVVAVSEVSFEASRSFLERVFANRSRTDREFWLVSFGRGVVTTEAQLEAFFSGVALDIDDDVFAFLPESGALMEAYKIMPGMEPTVNSVGNWSESEGKANFDGTRKYQRRRNLQVRLERQSPFHYS